jgi:phosphoribosylaminoimidazole carboxylase
MSRNIIERNFLPEMRKQRKMGHITIVGSSMFIVKAHLDKLLQRDTDAANKG